MNPLDMPGQTFELSMRNPNPSSGKTKAGPIYRVSFELDKDDWLAFMDAQNSNMVIAARMAVVPNVGNEPDLSPKAEKGPHGDIAQALYQSGFFLSPVVCQTLGSDGQFLTYIRQQPCANCKLQHGIQAAHVRRVANGSGTGIKPKYSAIPLCDVCHQQQHQHGESAIGGQAKVDRWRAQHLSDWGKLKMKEWFGVDSLTKISAIDLHDWAERNRFQHLLPRVVREQAEEAA